MDKVNLTLTLLFVFNLTALISCTDGETSHQNKYSDVETENREHSSAVRLTKEMLNAANFEIVEVEFRQMHRFISATAKVIPNQNRDAHVGPLIEGRAASILVNQGDRVPRGQILMYLESPQVADAKAAYYTAKAELAFAEADHERHIKLFEERIGSAKALAQAEASHDRALAQFEAAEKGLHAIGLSTEDIGGLQEEHEAAALLPIRAPITGTVIQRNVTIGERIEPSSDVFHIIDIMELWVDADVYEKDIAHVKLGDEMEVRVVAFADEKFRGKIIFISDMLEERTRTFKVRAAIKNPKRKLKPEMFADARISVTQEEKVLVIPRISVQFDGEKQFVYMAQKNPGVFVRRTVEAGREADEYVEILAGLKPGDRIIGRGAFLIKSEALKETFGEGHH